MKKLMVVFLVLGFAFTNLSFALESNFGLGFFVPHLKKGYCNDSEAAYWYPEIMSNIKLNIGQYDEDNKEVVVDLIVEQLNAWNHKLRGAYENVGGLDVIQDQLMSQSYSEIVSDISKLDRLYDRGRHARFLCEFRDATWWIIGN
ncbi:MAG: hypothetical protein A2504_17645 [Bdellovibrionales bacterium RIFOXYD12_FULL_39_22]|nr:MAG: hypothetical protein A2385_15345 [Bdellovibrionales bacterium RIFOXYB1_FULL_39_21]OFZ40616.1 MAG: hypothetical protein A2485_03420 [Bdellovibrionales bacterium RIFOXYC12_FULL_39_17]OFZ50436.1 MAG: hypothetical protein A2404_02645 [Bdellovibrionales bacterium RIFOXYC1_FULL_39_130]OFZ77695.1 MAG: hypothetical protein A2560_05015 [Bdellovibrionales bacterium RIFOXYD1_FULL_39_84]OFZ91729.1 MAG: hypothetical protein A2504_17645 [Bdellovibrionales bacterium RIFOXYD12_FULL_39_22]HLE13012.1 hy